jgi:hypothetical protein
MRALLLLIFSTNLALAQVPSSSNLPLLLINTNNQFINNEPKINVQLIIKYNTNGSRNYLTDADYYNGPIGIESRGSSSSTFGKISYGFEILNTTNTEVDTPLLQMPAASDWILNASHSDKTFMRNVLPHVMYTKLGNYSPRAQYVEVILDSVYMGLYLLQEKIKRGGNRLDIAKLKNIDTTGVAVTGGYILKSDKQTGGNGNDYFTSNYFINNNTQQYGFFYEYPSSSKINSKQKNYIKSYVDSAEAALWSTTYTNTNTGYRAFFNTTTFIDYLIVNEYGKNPDTYILSTYFYKPKDDDGRKFCMGPVWDFDLAFKNSFYFDADVDTGYIYTDGNRISLFTRMMMDSSFKNELACKWQEARKSYLSTATLHAWVDSVALLLQESQTRNFALYPILGQNVYYNSFPYPLTFNDEVDSLKAWISRRGAWLDTKWKGVNCNPLAITENMATEAPSLYPNPFNSYLTITDIAPYKLLRVINILGQQVCIITIDKQSNTITIPTTTWQSGLYYLSAENENYAKKYKIVKN